MDSIKRYGIAIVIAFGICALIKPALCFMMLGAILTYGGFTSISFLRKINRSGLTCTGNIVEYQSDSNGHKTPLIEFTTLTGETIQEKPFVYGLADLGKLRSYNVLNGKSVPVLYDPDDPKKFIVSNEKGFSYAFCVIFTLAGLFFIGLSIAWLCGYIKMD